jgi:hypothetical protein
MNIRDELHELVDQLKDDDAPAALTYLRSLRANEEAMVEEWTRAERDIGPAVTSGRAFFTQPHVDLLTLAARQDVQPIADFDAHFGDFWPEDESVDEFIAAEREWRREGAEARN